MPRYVPGYGNASAKLVVVGEAPGGREDEAGLPFVGPAGAILDEVLEYAELDRSQLYITNVVKYRPPDNKLSRLKEIGYKLEDFYPQLYEEIEAIGPNCILALGDTALTALTGCKGIRKYRGSILQYKGHGCKVIPSLHPASLMHEARESMKSWKELIYIKFDAARAAAQSLFKEVVLPQRSLQIANNSLDLLRFLDAFKTDKVTLDVETYKTYPLCIGIAFDRFRAMSVPLFEILDREPKFDEQLIPIRDMAFIWKTLIEFLNDTKTKVIGQNLKFDEKRCRQLRIGMHVWADIAMAWHTMYSELPKKLEFISSIITEEPYYKDEGREYSPKKDKISRLLLYNAKDAVVEHECWEKIEAELLEFGMHDWFFENIMPLHRFYSDVEDVGLMIDEEIRKNLKDKYAEIQKIKHKRLTELIEEKLGQGAGELNVNSPKQVGKMLYGYLRCPIRKDVKTDTLKALANNAIKDQERKEIIYLILEERRVRKTQSTYLNAETSADGRMHTTYNINGTESGRTSTSILEPPVSVFKEGWAFQTLTKHEDETMDAGGADLRQMCIADPGWNFLEWDEAQAEDRVVVVLSEDYEAFDILNKKNFKRNKYGIKDDRHTLTAMFVCEMSFDEITDYYRQIGKKVRHAGNYDMRKHQCMVTLANLGIFVSEWRAGKYLDKFHADNTKIRGVYHVGIQLALSENDCVLRSPHGRMRRFFNKWGDELFKEAYSFIPQATVSDHLKFAALRIVRRLDRSRFKICQESHDSMLALVKEGYEEIAVPVIREEMSVPIDFRKCTLSRDYQLVIPVDFKIGKSWGAMKDLKAA